ncbi:hypothetical protein DSO57_1018592 [Entomophthora muscae]|uniref:Uncharacterized protein n=1 Tax=Entomophthora muscae TaxID=34485 RepID=A0ACC2UPT2_9FUNG|nr:hypothetical protein DSO57_1018592 [Entomophthora muscae]
MTAPHPHSNTKKEKPTLHQKNNQLKEQLDFNVLFLAEEDHRYNVVTVETVPKTPANQSNHCNDAESNLEIEEVNPSSSYVPDVASVPDATLVDEFGSHPGGKIHQDTIQCNTGIVAQTGVQRENVEDSWRK